MSKCNVLTLTQVLLLTLDYRSHFNHTGLYSVNFRGFIYIHRQIHWTWQVCLCNVGGSSDKAHTATGRTCKFHREKPQLELKLGTFLPWSVSANRSSTVPPGLDCNMQIKRREPKLDYNSLHKPALSDLSLTEDMFYLMKIQLDPWCWTWPSVHVFGLSFSMLRVRMCSRLCSHDSCIPLLHACILSAS